MIELSQTFKELPAAMALVQAEIKNPKKDREGVHKAKYAQLETVIDVIKEASTKHGLSVTQLPYNDGSVFGVETMLMHKSGEWLRSRYGSDLNSKNPQDYGKAITYYRRYALGALFNIAPEDDDDADSLMPKAKLATDAQKKYLRSLMGNEKYLENIDFIENKMTSAQAVTKIEQLKEGK